MRLLGLPKVIKLLRFLKAHELRLSFQLKVREVGLIQIKLVHPEQSELWYSLVNWQRADSLWTEQILL